MSTIEAEHQKQVAQQGAKDSGQFFRYMADFVGLTPDDVAAIQKSKPVIEKHLPEIVTKFYAHLLRYPPTRKLFVDENNVVNQTYLELRMHHLANFWLRTADAVFDDEYAQYVDYVGRAHTARGADPKIYISERYVIGQVGMVQHALTEALAQELSAGDNSVEVRTIEAWDKLMMIVLELLARAYGSDGEMDSLANLPPVDDGMVSSMAAAVVAHAEGKDDPLPTEDVVVAAAADFTDESRKIVDVNGQSIGVFHHAGQWYALRNSCVHRGGPVATGKLEGDVLICPWHGFRYDVTTGRCLTDTTAALDTFPVTIRDDQVHLLAPAPAASRQPAPAPAAAPSAGQPAAAPLPAQDAQPTIHPEAHKEEKLNANEFRPADLAPGQMTLVDVDGEDVAVYNVSGAFYATDNACTHADGPLNEGTLDGKVVTCPWHGSCFDVITGAVVCGPATEPVDTYKVTIAGEIGRVEAK